MPVMLIAALMLIAEGCAIVHQVHETRRADSHSRTEMNPAQSWDQENLKRDDHGCPTAVFVAPGGNLEQC